MSASPATTPTSEEPDPRPIDPPADAGMGAALVGVGVLGVSLWAQLLVPALMTELRLPRADLVNLSLYAAPLLVGAAALALRSGPAALLLYPLSLLPALAIRPVEDQVATADGWAMARIAVTMAVYLALASAWAAGAARRGTGQVDRSAIDGRGRLYRGFVASRLAPMLLLFVVPTYAIFFDPAVVATLGQNHPESPQTAQIFLSMVVFFVWSVAAYTSFLVPALNLEYDGRRLAQQADELARGLTRRRVFRRIGLTALGVAVAVAAALGLQAW